jgi:hypothetical protein
MRTKLSKSPSTPFNKIHPQVFLLPTKIKKEIIFFCYEIIDHYQCRQINIEFHPQRKITKSYNLFMMTIASEMEEDEEEFRKFAFK